MSAHPTPRGARELSKEELAARRQAAYQHDQRLRTAIRLGRDALWEMAAACTQIADAQAFRDLGYDSLNEYLGDPEISMSRTHFMRMTRVYRFAQSRKLLGRIADLDLSKLDIALPAMRDGHVIIDEALSDVETLSRRDLIEKYIGEKADNDGAPAASATGGTDQNVVSAADLSAPASAADVLDVTHDAQHDGDGVEDQDPPQSAQESVSERVQGEVVGEDGVPVEDGTDAPVTSESGLFDSTEDETPPEPSVGPISVEANVALYRHLMDAVASGATMPRVNAQRVAECLDAYALLIRAHGGEV